ncbi:MAG: sulfite exporter TauE/SafE family protein [Nitrososphaerota archaeon]|nr:sulfite exporter TauE/SafE family protein [Candidatus Bathyarchaeota archaeon]MDW8023189.1 sulfite exporter TauE/SafE family protein [Nitrososphaerota archaeon]
MSFLGLIIIGLVAGALLASTGIIGLFLVPALILLGLPSDFARGTTLVSELLMTLVSVVGHGRRRNLDKRIIAAYLPGAFAVIFGANMSFKYPEPLMRLLVGIFEIVIGLLIILFFLKSNEKAKVEPARDITPSTMIKLMIVALLAGFTKGFFGAGWGPIGIGLFILFGITPHIVVGSSLVIRLLLDIAGGATYAFVGLVDYNAVVLLTLAGCVSALFAIKITRMISERKMRIFIGSVITLLGILVVLESF